MSPEGSGPVGPVQPHFCSRCGGPLAPGSNFCSKCGQPLAPAAPPYYQPYQAPQGMTLRSFIMGIGSYAAVALLVLMAANVIITIWAAGLVYPHMDTGAVTLFVITPYIVGIASLGGGWFFLYYVFLALAVVASFVWLLWKSIGPLNDELVVRYPPKGHSPLYVVATLFMAVLSFNIIYYLFIQGAGASPTTPSFSSQELWQIIYGFARASVWEEVVSRILLIGLPLLLVDQLLLSPDRKMRKIHQYILGGGLTIGRREAILLVFSSIMFGAAHAAGGWDLFKIVPAAVAGLAFGYLFLRLGVYAAILLHFSTDFLSVPLDVFPNNDTLTTVIGLALIMWVVVGVPYMLLYASKGLGWLRGKRIWPDVPQAKVQPTYGTYYGTYQYAPYPPAPYVPPAPYAGSNAPPPVRAPPPPQGRDGDPTAFGFTCRNCGNREALYKDGQLTCTRCGMKN
jgi:hypothetical protein